MDVTTLMIEAVEGTRYEGTGTLLDAYRAWMDGELPSLMAKIEAKKAEIAELVDRFTMLPKSARTALESAACKVDALQTELDALEADAEPLTERLEVLVGQVRELKESLNNADVAMSGDDMRKKADGVRRVIDKVVLQFRHYEHQTTDRRSKGRTIPKSTLEAVEIHPWAGEVKVLPRAQPIAVDNRMGRG